MSVPTSSATDALNPIILNTRPNNKMFLFIDVLVNEVKKRPLLWDKRHEDYGNRKKVNKNWLQVAAILKKRPDEVKAKWRNLKDSFYREEKRIDIQHKDDGKPVISYYTGQWVHFEKLLFLRDTRYNRSMNGEYIGSDIPEISVGDIKGEFSLSEQSNESSECKNDQSYDKKEPVYIEPVITLQSVLTSGTLATSENNVNEEDKRKRSLVDNEIEEIEKKKRLKELRLVDGVIDEDLHFVKSLVPFLRKLNPIRKLIVRNEIQNLLIKELLCDNCSSYGPQPNCKCNLS